MKIKTKLFYRNTHVSVLAAAVAAAGLLGPASTHAASLTGLGDLPGGSFFSWANGVSGDGSTVVGFGFSASGSEAFRHTAAGGMERLWDVLLAAGIDPTASGWSVLNDATGVSLDGNTIVGFGVRNGNQEAFVAVIPEPTTLSMIAVSAIGLLARRRRRENVG